MPTDRATLQQFYQQTHYTVVLPRQRLTFRIGRYDEQTEAMLKQHCGVTRNWAILTPYNPNSKQTDEDANHVALMRLRQDLDTASLKRFDSVNMSPEGEWHELGFLVVDATSANIKALARRYRQNAYVAAKLGEAPQLVWMI
jgi:hypothetical protein